MQIIINILNDILTLQVFKMTSILFIKQFIANKYNIPVSKIRLVANKYLVLHDNKYISNYNFFMEDTIIHVSLNKF